MAALAQVIGGIVNDNGSTDDGVLTEQLDQVVLLGALGNTVGVGGDVTQVTDVSLVVLWGTVVLTGRVEVRTSGSTTVGVVTKGVDVETSQSVSAVTGDLPGDGGWLRFGSLDESNDTVDVLVTSKNSNC